MPILFRYLLREYGNIFTMCFSGLMTIYLVIDFFEKVRRFVLLDEPFTIESGEMTPSMKIRRKAVEERYRDLIEEMYGT